MKKLITLSLFVVFAFANDKTAAVENFKFMFEKIGEKRVGVKDAKVDSIIIPFESEMANKKKELKKQPKKAKNIKKKSTFQQSYNLQAIVGKRAKISGNWYRVNNKIADYKVTLIKNGIVWLQHPTHKKRLTIRKENEKITIK